MSCFDPLLAWWNLTGCNVLDKPKIIGKYRGVVHDEFRLFQGSGLPVDSFPQVGLIRLPCGHCDGCLMDRAQMWTFRNIVEARYHNSGCFLTLTVSDDNMQRVFPGGMLCHDKFQLFMKSLRKAVGEIRKKLSGDELAKVDPVLKYMMCGEYGDQFGRPHYHCLLYGFDFPDKYFWKMNDHLQPLYRSPFLEKIWKHGNSWIGALERGSIAYVCRYVLKKAHRVQDRPSEYVRMSLRPALGYQWFQDVGLSDIYNHSADGVFPNDFVFLDDRKLRPPRYYDKKYEALRNVDFVSLKFQRRQLAGSDVFSVSNRDLEEAEDYFKCVVKGRINSKGFNNV